MARKKPTLQDAVCELIALFNDSARQVAVSEFERSHGDCEPSTLWLNRGELFMAERMLHRFAAMADCQLVWNKKPHKVDFGTRDIPLEYRTVHIQLDPVP